jgi:hypothetical protein
VTLTTAKGIRYPESTDHTRIYDHMSAMASDVDGLSLSAANGTAVAAALGVWTAWTPTWSTSTGLHLPTYGNAVTSAWYLKLGRTLMFSMSIAFGTTTNFGASPSASDNWIFSLPPGLTAQTAWLNAALPVGHARLSLTGSGATSPATAFMDAGGTNLQIFESGGRVDATAITNVAAIDSLTPWTWASGGGLQLTGMVEWTS